MKVSQYNSIYDFPSNPSQKLMFNAKSLALALVDCSKVEQYENYCQTHEEIPDEAFLNDLKTGGFLIDDSIDEKAILKYEQLCSRYSRSHLSLVIAATSNCNFRCVYCYERSVLRASTMSEATQEAIVKFVESEAPHLESFTVTWYGGEPLLALDIIESLSLKFIDICKKNDIAYGATIVTNGYLLNCAVVEKLNTLYVNQYQVTLDGRKEIHDCSRPLANGGGTYDVITQNLIDV
ncbi:4Fe-4S cluster-binding domain-containing protein, partial [Enterococcus durans]|nr:4Fe-4S cluster-binding domain-containing protein [Enterococcus durans]